MPTTLVVPVKGTCECCKQDDRWVGPWPQPDGTTQQWCGACKMFSRFRTPGFAEKLAASFGGKVGDK